MSAHKRPEPLLDKAKVTATINGLVSQLVTWGVLAPTVGEQISRTVLVVIAAVGLLLSTVPVVLHALSARKVVTPVSDPRDNDGGKLVAKPADDVTDDVPATPVDVAAALAAADAVQPVEVPEVPPPA